VSERFRHDVLIIGSGAAGLAAALHLSDHARVAVLSKYALDAGSTDWAQGGIAAVTDSTDTEFEHVQDTLRAGAGLSRERTAWHTVCHAQEVISQLAQWGIDFDRDGNQYHLTQEGGHSFRRILHVADATGHAVSSNLIREARQRESIDMFTNRAAIDLITTARLGYPTNRCFGAYVLNQSSGRVEVFEARHVVIATGGASKVYLYTSNPDGSTGDGIAMAWRAGCRVANMEFIQFHPTCLYIAGAARVLISEVLRGAGGVLRDRHGDRFMPAYHPQAELAPRDVVSRAVFERMVATGDTNVYLDLSSLDRDPHAVFPGISEICRFFGIDIARDPILVRLGCHYMIGGLATGLDGRTSVGGLWAVGECASSGLHGANRMGSNSLLEALVFADVAATEAIDRLSEAEPPGAVPAWQHGEATPIHEAVVITQNWDEIRRFMWNYVGVVRSDRRLSRARHRIEMLREEINEYYWNFRVTPELIELRNLATVAELIIRSASFRKESRGLHYNLDHPDRDDANFGRDTLIQRGDNPWISPS